MAIIQDNMAGQQPNPNETAQITSAANANQPDQSNDAITQSINQIAQSAHLYPTQAEGFKRLSYAGMQVIHNQQTHDAIMQMLKDGAASPAETLAKTTVFVMSSLVKTANQQIPPLVLLTSAVEVMLMLAQLCGETQSLKVDSSVIGQAFHLGIQLMQQTFSIPDEVVAPIAELLTPDKFSQMAQQYAQSPQGQQATSQIKSQVAQKYAPLVQQAQQQKAQQIAAQAAPQQPNQPAGV